MLEPQTLVSYLSNVEKTCDAYDLPFPVNGRKWTLPLADLRAGVLPTHMTREILLSYSLKHEECTFGERKVPLVCILRTASSMDDTNSSLDMLALTGVLDASGTIVPGTDSRAWIPRRLLDTHEMHNGSLTLCDLDAYGAHKVAMQTITHDGTWETAVNRALDLFEVVATLDECELEKRGFRVTPDVCSIRIWEHPDEAKCIRETLDDIATELSSFELGANGAISAPLACLIASDDAPHETTVELPDDGHIGPKLVCAMPDHIPLLEQSDHEMLASFAQQNANESLAVKAPIGTSSAALALAAIATTFTESALRGDKAPTVVCVGTDTELRELASILSSKPTASQVALSTRWLPRIARTQPNDAGLSMGKRVLGPLPTLCLLHTSDGIDAAAIGTTLSQPFAHPNGGDMALYGDSWYTPKASIYFLDCVSGFLGERMRSVAQARQRLSEVLRIVDQDRCELIDAYANVCKASELLRRRDDLVTRIGHMRRAHTFCKKRIAYWDEVQREHPARRPLFGNSEIDQTSLIAKHMQAYEELAEGKSLIADVIGSYEEEVARLENAIDRLRSASLNLAKRIRDVAPEGERCAEIISRLVQRCKLTHEQAGLLEAAIDGRQGDVTIDTLEHVLDQTIRPAEFWLAVHVYESRWLDICQHRSHVEHGDGEIATTIGIWSTICPFELIPVEAAEGLLRSATRDSRDRLDLMVMLGAGSLDVAHGIALASHTNRLIAFGTFGSYAAPVLQNETFDNINATTSFGVDVWQALSDAQLCVSQNVTFFDLLLASNGIKKTSLTSTHCSYEELDHLRTTLFPNEPLETFRKPRASFEDEAYSLTGILPSLSYVVVPDSAWEQYGASRRNRAEAMALIRWLKNHCAEIGERFFDMRGTALLITSPFEAQTELLRELIMSEKTFEHLKLDVLTTRSAKGRTWPLVVMSTTCGAESFETYGEGALSCTLNTAVASARDAFLLFCGNAWTQSSSSIVRTTLEKMEQIGRLYSSPRTRKTAVSSSNSKSKAGFNLMLELKSKPLAITTLLKRLHELGEIETIPSSSSMNHILCEHGLIERVSEDSGKVGWRPTASGREVGILPTRDRNGNPFCAYTSSTAAIVANLAGEAVDLSR